MALIKGVHLLEETSLSDVLDVLSSLRGGTPLPSPARPTVKAPTPAPRPVVATSASTEVKAPAPPVASLVIPSPITNPLSPPLASESEIQNPHPIPSPSPNSDSPLPIPDPWHATAMQLAGDSPLKFGWVEECLSSRLGTNIKLESRFNGEEPPAPPEPEPIPVSTSGFPAKPSSASPKSVAPSIQSAKAPEPIPPMISPEELKEFKNDPLIKKALEIFKAEILVSPPVAGA